MSIPSPTDFYHISSKQEDNELFLQIINLKCPRINVEKKLASLTTQLIQALILPRLYGCTGWNCKHINVKVKWALTSYDCDASLTICKGVKRLKKFLKAALAKQSTLFNWGKLQMNSGVI
ncbi:hypothetical protein DP117_20405 [Brasilonema sp. UFV-L1]|nr:hypothetical protein [Brasilonema sp. UFV-L1]